MGVATEVVRRAVVSPVVEAETPGKGGLQGEAEGVPMATARPNPSHLSLSPSLSLRVGGPK